MKNILVILVSLLPPSPNGQAMPPVFYPQVQNGQGNNQGLEHPQSWTVTGEPFPTYNAPRPTGLNSLAPSFTPRNQQFEQGNYQPRVRPDERRNQNY